MSDAQNEYLTTKELGELLRIKERKVYDLASAGDVPCVRVVGKLLFPRAEVETWLRQGYNGPTVQDVQIPAIVTGSHDPLLDWALRESGSGLAAFFDGSFDGLERFKNYESIATGLHIHEATGWNTQSVTKAVGDQPIVLLEFATRQRGIIVPAGNPSSVSSIADLAGLRFAKRQQSAASQQLFSQLAVSDGVDPKTLAGPEAPARTEDDVARLVQNGKADAAFGLAASASQFRLDFIPVTEERFDLAVRRKFYFEPAFQRLLKFFSSVEMRGKADELTGYDITEIGKVIFNGTAP